MTSFLLPHGTYQCRVLGRRTVSERSNDGGHSVTRVELVVSVAQGPYTNRQVSFTVWGDARGRRARQLTQGQGVWVHVTVITRADGRLVNRVADFEPIGQLTTINTQASSVDAGSGNGGSDVVAGTVPRVPQGLLRRLKAALDDEKRAQPLDQSTAGANATGAESDTECDSLALQYSYGFRASTKKGTREIVDFERALCRYAALDAAAGVGEGYLSVYQYSTELGRHQQAGEKRSLSGYRGQAWARWLVIDIDGKETAEDLDRTFRAAGKLVDALVALGVPRARVLVFYSGSRGVHVLFPSRCFGATAQYGFERIAGTVCCAIAALVGVEIDPSMYRPLASLRAPNTTHDTSGLRKVLIGHEDLSDISSDRIRHLASQPRPFELPEWRVPTVPLLVDMWRWACEADHVPAVVSGHTPTSKELRIYASTFDLMVHGAPDGTRGTRFFRAAMNLLDFECPEELLHALLEPAAKLSSYPVEEFLAQVNGAMKAHAATRSSERL